MYDVKLDIFWWNLFEKKYKTAFDLMTKHTGNEICKIDGTEMDLMKVKCVSSTN